MVASWSPAQKVAGSNPFVGMTNIFHLEFADSMKTFRKKSNDPRSRLDDSIQFV